MSKGSTPRPLSVSNEEFSKSWNAIFKKEICPECQSMHWNHARSTSACGMEADYKLCEDCGHRWDIG